MDIEDKIDELVSLYHRVQMKHINADRMGDSFLRKEGYKLEEEYETKRQEFLNYCLLAQASHSR